MKAKIRRFWILVGLFTLGLLLVGCSLLQTRCGTPLEEEVINRLLISPEDDLGVVPGETLQLELAVVECCTFYQTVDACASWELVSGEGASLTTDGRLTVSEDAAHGEQIEVAANVERGRRIVQTTIEVYREDANPLVGQWIETSRINCATGEEFTPRQVFREVIFKADGSFQITKQPFELYFDYLGTYSYDAAAGTFSMTATRGNRIPEDLDGEGTFRIAEDGTLVLESIWFGLAETGEPAPSCGHRLTPR